MKTLLVSAALTLAACQIPAPSKPLAPKDAADSTFRVDIVGMGTGTGWIAYNDYQASYLVTAGHVCEDGATFKIVGRDGFQYPAYVVRKHSKWDLCLMRTDEVVGPALELSPAPPEYDEPVMAVGAPLGVYACDSGSTIEECGMAPISRGYYAGGTLVSMPMAGGNSGSAVFTYRGVIGVLVEGYRGFDSLSFIEPLDHLREFVTK